MIRMMYIEWMDADQSYNGRLLTLRMIMKQFYFFNTKWSWTFMGWKFEIKILGLYFFLHENLNAIFFSMECIKKAVFPQVLPMA